MSTFQNNRPIEPTATPRGYSDKSFLHTQEAAVKVPLSQSAATGFTVFIISLVIAFKVNAMDVITWPLVFGGLAFGGMWFGLTYRWLVLTKLEQLTGIDINKDGEIGSVSHVQRSVRVQVDHVRENGHVGDSAIFTMPASDEQLQSLAEGLRRGRRFSQRAWSDIFTRTEFEALIAVMVKKENGLAVMKNEKFPQQGYVLTDAGQAFMEQYLTSPTPYADMD